MPRFLSRNAGLVDRVGRQPSRHQLDILGPERPTVLSARERRVPSPVWALQWKEDPDVLKCRGDAGAVTGEEKLRELLFFSPEEMRWRGSYVLCVDKCWREGTDKGRDTEISFPTPYLGEHLCIVDSFYRRFLIPWVAEEKFCHPGIRQRECTHFYLHQYNCLMFILIPPKQPESHSITPAQCLPPFYSDLPFLWKRANSHLHSCCSHGFSASRDPPWFVPCPSWGQPATGIHMGGIYIVWGAWTLKYRKWCLHTAQLIPTVSLL